MLFKPRRRVPDLNRGRLHFRKGKTGSEITQRMAGLDLKEQTSSFARTAWRRGTGQSGPSNLSWMA